MQSTHACAGARAHTHTLSDVPTLSNMCNISQRCLAMSQRNVAVVVAIQERRKKEREIEEKRLAAERAAEDARRKGEEVSPTAYHPYTFNNF